MTTATMAIDQLVFLFWRKKLRASACDWSNVNDDDDDDDEEVRITASDGDGSNVNKLIVEEDGSKVNGDGNEEKDESEGYDSMSRTTEGLDSNDDMSLLRPS